MNIGITGGTGFIGSHLLAVFSRSDFQVRVLSRKSIESTGNTSYIVGDLEFPDQIPKNFFVGLDVLIHCAGVMTDYERMNQINTKGTILVYKLACQYGVRRFVNLSSIGIYKKVKNTIINENSLIGPDNSYELTKAAGDEYLLNNASSIRELVILRPSTVYANDMINNSLFQLIKAIYFKYFLFIGCNQSCMNIIHVDDVARALFKCAVTEVIPSKIYNLSLHCSINNFVQIVRIELGRMSPDIRIPRWFAYLCAGIGSAIIQNFPLTNSRVRALSSNIIYSSKRIEDELNFFPSVDNASGLKNLAAYWFLNYKDKSIGGYIKHDF